MLTDIIPCRRTSTIKFDCNLLYFYLKLFRNPFFSIALHFKFPFCLLLDSVVNRKELNRSFHRTSSIGVAAAICKPSWQLRACELYFLFHIGFSGVILGTFSIKQFGIGLVNTFPHIWNLCYQVSSSEMILQSMHPRCFTLSWSQKRNQHSSRPIASTLLTVRMLFVPF